MDFVKFNFFFGWINLVHCYESDGVADEAEPCFPAHLIFRISYWRWRNRVTGWRQFHPWCSQTFPPPFSASSVFKFPPLASFCYVNYRGFPGIRNPIFLLKVSIVLPSSPHDNGFHQPFMPHSCSFPLTVSLLHGFVAISLFLRSPVWWFS